MSYIQAIYNRLRKLGFSEIGAVAMLWASEYEEIVGEPYTAGGGT